MLALNNKFFLDKPVANQSLYLSIKKVGYIVTSNVSLRQSRQSCRSLRMVAHPLRRHAGTAEVILAALVCPALYYSKDIGA